MAGSEPPEPGRRQGDQENAAANVRKSGDLSGKLVALVIVAVVVAGATLAWLILPF